MRRALVAIVLLGLAAAACSAPAGEGTTTTSPGGTTLGAVSGEDTVTGGVTGVASTFDPASVRFEAALMRFDSCEALLGYFQSEALARVGPYGLDGGPGYYPGPWLAARDGMAVSEEMMGTATTTAAATTTANGGDGGYSTTNVQVAGVDEPDTIKNDGERILTIMNGTLYYVEVDGGTGRLASMAAPSTTRAPGWRLATTWPCPRG